jgi:hypothetical protein
MMLKLNDYTIINTNEISLLNLNSNYVYLNGDTLKVTDDEMKFILNNIEVTEPKIEKVVKKNVEATTRKTAKAKDTV